MRKGWLGKVRRWAGLSAAACMAAGMLAGCGSSAENGTGGTAVGSKAESAADSDGSQGSSIAYWTNMDSSRIAPTTDNYANILCYQEMEKNTGVNVEFIHPPIGQEADAFSLLMASGEYPDIIYYDWGNKVAGGPDKAIEDGVILRLNELPANGLITITVMRETCCSTGEWKESAMSWMRRESLILPNRY